MSDDSADLKTLDAAIARAIDALSKADLDPEIRVKLEQELAIFTELRREISSKGRETS